MLLLYRRKHHKGITTRATLDYNAESKLHVVCVYLYTEAPEVLSKCLLRLILHTNFSVCILIGKFTFRVIWICQFRIHNHFKEQASSKVKLKSEPSTDERSTPRPALLDSLNGLRSLVLKRPLHQFMVTLAQHPEKWQMIASFAVQCNDFDKL